MKHEVLLCAALFSVAATAGEVRPLWGANLDIAGGFTSVRPAAFVENWGGLRASGGITPAPDGSRAFSLQAHEKDELVDKINGRIFFRNEGDAVRVKYEFTPKSLVSLKQLCVTSMFRVEDISGGTVHIGEKTVQIPAELGSVQFFRDTVSNLTLADSGRRVRLSLSFDRPVDIMLQDDRKWGGNTFSLRIVLGGERVYRPDEKIGVSFLLSDGGVTRVAPDADGVTISAGAKWVPLSVDPDVVPGSALDFSALRGTDAPAGRHGRILARGEHFVFEDSPDVPRRFYGVNICGYANVPDPESARRFARRLSMTGYNAIRFHHHECVLVEKDGVTLNSDRMNLFDSLVAACIENGLYLTTDLFVSRRPISYRSIGIDKDGLVDAAEFKELVLAHEGAYDNFISFARAFLGHVNPYTGRSLAQEPALGWLALVNEGNLGNSGMQYMKQHRVFLEKWRGWLSEKKRNDPARYQCVSDALPVSLAKNEDPHVRAYTLFMQELESDFAKRVRRFLRDEMKCHALTTDMNGWHYPAPYQLPRSKCHDYVDCHFYIDHPEFLDKPWKLPSKCPNVNPIAGKGMGAHHRAFGRVYGRPFTVSEFNYSAPGRFRCVGGIAAGAMGALQDWGAMWRFAWSHDDWGLKMPDRKRLNYFDMCGDPLGLAAERAVICLFLRADARPLERSMAIGMALEDLRTPVANPMMRPDYTWAMWYMKVGSAVNGGAPADVVSLEYPGALSLSSAEAQKRIFPSGDRPASAGDGQVEIDGKTGRFLLSTSRTCGGFAESGRFRAGVFEVDVGDTPATVWVSSLDGRPIGESARLLVTHLTDVQNTGMRYADRERRILTDWGRLPHLMRVGQANIGIKAGKGDWVCHSLSSGGARRREIAVKTDGSSVAFTADVAVDRENATYLYELIRRK